MMHSHLEEEEFTKMVDFVLILVVMDDALALHLTSLLKVMLLKS